MQPDGFAVLVIGMITISYLQHRSCKSRQSKRPELPKEKPPSAQEEVDPTRWRSDDEYNGNRRWIGPDPMVEQVLAFGNVL